MNTDFARRGALWRIHGLAAIVATPFLLAAAVTGLLYVATPQVEAWRYAQLDAVTPAPWLPLDRLVHGKKGLLRSHSSLNKNLGFVRHKCVGGGARESVRRECQEVKH